MLVLAIFLLLTTAVFLEMADQSLRAADPPGGQAI